MTVDHLKALHSKGKLSSSNKKFHNTIITLRCTVFNFETLSALAYLTNKQSVVDLKSDYVSFLIGTNTNIVSPGQFIRGSVIST